MADRSAPAFPTQGMLNGNGDAMQYPDAGMTLREYIAAHAPAGPAFLILGQTSPEMMAEAGETRLLKIAQEAVNSQVEFAVEYADKLIAALNAKD